MVAVTDRLINVRMADGLGVNEDEWAELRSQIDDSFWVMRIIGGFVTYICLALA